MPQPVRSPRVAIVVLSSCCAAWGLSFPIIPLFGSGVAALVPGDGLRYDLGLSAAVNA